MAFDYSPFIADAQAMIEEFGGTLTLKRRNPTWDASKPWRKSSDGVDSETDFKGVIISFNHDEVDGETIKTGDMRLLVAPGVIVPQFQDYVIDGDDQWQVQNVAPVKPAGTVVLYDVHLRQ